MDPGAAWKSYDSVAQGYDRWSATKIFAAPAKDLVDLLGIEPGAAVLDVGTGTGVTAAQAMARIGAKGCIVATDPSLGMLVLARRRRLQNVVASRVPGLPFGSSVFDNITASFILSHLPSYTAGLSEVLHLLKPGGSIGVTAWKHNSNRYSELWQKLADSCGVNLTDARTALASEDELRDPVVLKRALDPSRANFEIDVN